MSFTPDHVRLAEALYRSEVHCAIACELYSTGRPADAALHSVRPIADTFPWLETELRAHPEQLRNLMVAVSNLSGAVRHGVKPRIVRKHLKTVSEARSAVLDVVVGPPSSSTSFKASVGLALLEEARSVYSDGVPEGNLNDYQAAFGLVREALDLLCGVGVADDDEGRSLVAALQNGMPGLEPPPQLLRPEDVDVLVQRLGDVAVESAGAVRARRSALDDLARVELLLDDVVRAYDDGVAALSARLAASLFVRSYDPLRSELHAIDAAGEEELAEILGVDLRRAINAGVGSSDVSELADRARSAISSLRESASRPRDSAASTAGP
jgi:hypothetical protein